MAEERYKELFAKRTSAKGQITRFKNYLNNISKEKELSDIQLTMLNLKLAKFESLSVKVDDLQSEIEVLSSANMDIELNERDNMEKDIIMSIATAKNLIVHFSKCNEYEQRRQSLQNTSLCVDDAHHNVDIGLKLPQIEIAKFSGEYFRWLEFRDTFENLIHKNERIPNINKFHYLNSYLQGDAARVVSNLEVSAINYPEAWQLLCSRYNNKRMLINHHLNSLFTIKPLSHESERSLRFIVDHVTKNLRALSSLGQPTDKWDVLVVFMLSKILDTHTLLKWEEHRSRESDEAPTLLQFFKFLTDRANVLESLGRNNNYDYRNVRSKSFMQSRSNYNKINNAKPIENNNVKSFASTSNYKKPNKIQNAFVCVICNGRHRIYDCPNFKAKGIDERIIDVEKYKLRINCLRQGHAVSECRMGPCRVHDCSERHNSLLHRPSSTSTLVDIIEPPNLIVNHSNGETSQVLLSTAMIEVSNPFGSQKIKVRALLDCGSQSSFITQSLKNKLSLNTQPIEALNIIGIGNLVNNKTTESCIIKLQSLHTKFNVSLPCFVLQQLTGQLPRFPFDINLLKLPDNIQLADPMLHQPAPIDVLIGADIFWDILVGDCLSLGMKGTKLINSQFGWLVSGPIPVPSKFTHCNNVIFSQSDSENIEKLLTKFWDIEDVPIKNSISVNDLECERHYFTNTTRDNTGRFCVKLPLKESADCLGDTFDLAKARFINLEKRFKRNPNLKMAYSKFINEYAEAGHLSVSGKHFIHSSTPYYYLCHHAVYKQESESTKLRVVFDGSAASSSGYGLNDISMIGPNIQDSLFAILIRARQYKYLLTGDIEKMYRQVLVDKDDRHLQLILWRDNESQPLQTLILNTVTYGTASASYLSTRCLSQIGSEQDDQLIKTIIQRDFYVDDLITGSNDPQQLMYMHEAVSSALASGCFNLRKLKTNCPSIFKNTLVNNQDSLTFSESFSTLGLGWDPINDTLHFPVKGFSYDGSNITKRVIMSNAFKIFDPLGILSPIVVKPKIMLQRLWQQKVDWDEAVPQEERDKWIKFCDDMKYLTKLQVPRLVLGESAIHVELHSFSDASMHALGACIYMRTINANDEVTIRLLCAKSKVAPLKPTTIPRLELCAALLAAKLTKSVVDSLRHPPNRIVHWCDSSVVLGWLRTDVTRLKMFVANRICEIKELTSSMWRYVPTDVNPADLVSRGVDIKQFISMPLWWSGPSFLLKNESEWPVLNSRDSTGLPELKVHSAITMEGEYIIDFNMYSSITRLQRAYAFVHRFIHNIRNSHNKRVGILTVEELRESFYALCVIAQRQCFPNEYELLKLGKPIKNKCKISSLSPFFDENKLIRVGGRISASTQPYDQKHLILLHASHRLTKLYFEREHIKSLHAGPQLLLATVRETVWPINGRYLARRVVNNCLRCRRLRGKTMQPKMGDLPRQRVNVDYPFLSVGLDFAGPFNIVDRKGRGSRLIKIYLCLFICLRYKCLHLEAVSGLSKDLFIMTLRRFIARRGKPVEIFCDNGGNFVAGSKEVEAFLGEAHKPLSDFASQQSIKFNFIPAYSPHFGGIWEAGVKSAKYHIKRVIGNSHLTFEEISTLFAQVEAILNSRPLCPLSSSPTDLLPLSPGHFMIGRPLTASPIPNLEQIKESQLQRYMRVEKIRQHFWQRWQKEYLCELQQRTKWKTNKASLKVGDMVLLADPNTPPLTWRLGRVLNLIPGQDGISRVADILTNKGCVRRSLVRLCKLPTAEEL